MLQGNQGNIRAALSVHASKQSAMNTLWRTFAVLPFLALFSQLASGQGMQVAPISLNDGDLFTVTAFGTNIPFPISFRYVAGVQSIVSSPTTTAVFAFVAADTNKDVRVFNGYYSNSIRIAPTPNGPNSEGIYVPPMTLGQQSVTATLIGNFEYPITYAVVNNPNLVTYGQVQSGTTEFTFNAPQSFSLLDVFAYSDGGFTARALATPFVGMTVSPTPIGIGAAVTVNVTATADAAASITYQLIDSDGNTASSAESPADGTTWQFNAPAVTGVYQLSVINGIYDGSTYGLAYTPLTVIFSPSIAQPIPGASLLAGSPVTASIAGCDPASSYTLSFVNGVFAYVTTVPGAISMPVLPVPSNYLGQMYLTVAQGGLSDVATYTISVARAVYNVRGNLRRRAHIGG
jgi:hypothetical protein